MQPAIRAVVYTRVSTERQAEEGTSLETQRLACLRKAQELNATVVGTFSDEGISGATLNRPGIQAAIGEIEAGRANLLICYDVSRFSREREHQSKLRKRIEAAGGRLAFVTLHLDETIESELLFHISGDMAHYFRKDLRRKAIEGRFGRANEGIQPNRTNSPFGYHIVNSKDIIRGDYPAEELGKYVLVEPRASYAKEVFLRYSRGASLRTICHWLDSEGVATSQNATAWHASTIKKILQNPVYKGYALFGRQEVIPDEGRTERLHKGRLLKQSFYYRKRSEEDCVRISTPALVDEETWETCQQRLANNNDRLGGNPNRTYMLKSLVFCPHCRLRMVGQPKGDLGYYTCSPSRKCCSKHYRADLLEPMVLAILRIIAHTPELMQQALEAYNRKQQETVHPVDPDCIREELAALAVQEKATAAAQVEALIKGRSGEVYDRLLEDIQTQRSLLQTKLEVAEARRKQSGRIDVKSAAEKVAQILTDVDDALSEDISRAEKNIILTSIIREIRPEEEGFHIQMAPIRNGETVHQIHTTS